MILCSVGPTSGALAAPQFVREMRGAGHQVEVVLEARARHFVGPAAFAGGPLPVAEPPAGPEAVVFAPATAGKLARLARGLESPGGAAVYIAPDLDPATYAHPAVRENLRLLREGGCRVIEGRGGGMVPAEEIATRVLAGLGGPMSGLRVLITAGGTREPIDSVRFIGNRSSGKMGLALAREAVRRGAEVSVVAANVERGLPAVEWVPVETVEEMRAEVLRRAREAEALIMAAAVSDFTPSARTEGKIRRREAERLSLDLVATPDILEELRRQNSELFVVGFAATHGDPVPDAREKLRSKGTDLLVGNDISRAGIGFGSDENEVYIVSRDGERFVPRSSKAEVAREILDALAYEIEKEKRD